LAITWESFKSTARAAVNEVKSTAHAAVNEVKSTAHAAVDEVKSWFSNAPPGSTEKCAQSMPANLCTWTADDLTANLAKCDGGTGIYAKAKSANGDRDPIIRPGPSALVTGGLVNIGTGEITLENSQDRCFATQVLIQELTNLSHKNDFNNAIKNADNGLMSREDYIRTVELYEYDGVQNVIKAFDTCKDSWGCTTCEKEWARQYRTFDEYYSKALSKEHKELYGQVWDTYFKAAFERKRGGGGGGGGW
jgi:hypothetical protein